MSDKPMPFYKGKVHMVARLDPRLPGTILHGPDRQVAEKVFDHGDKDARLQVRNFVHTHLCLGHIVESWPI